MNHYQILGVSRDATKADLKNAYRRLVKTYHPDLNPSPEAKEKIRLINEAYEVLSDYYSRNAYNLGLDGITHASQQPPEETEEEKYKREYLRKKAHEERVRMENLMKIKVRFYRFQRVVCFFFFLSGLVFTVDYYFSPYESDADIVSMKQLYRQTEVGTYWGTINCSSRLFEEYKHDGGDQVAISFSLIFEIPTKVGMKGSSNSYSVTGTLHSFGNIFTLIVLIFSAIVIRNKEYSDFRLTCGIVPGFLVPFLYLMAMAGG